MKQQPTLQSKRLILRPFRLDDAAEVQRLAGDWEVANMSARIPHPYKDGIAEAWIQTHQEKFESGELVTCAITQSDDGRLIGCIGLTMAAAHERAELGYWIGRMYWGQGCCTEAARAVLQYGFSVLRLARIVAHHFGRNPASGRVMAKIGMRQEGILRQHFKKGDRWEDVVCYGILKEEFTANQKGHSQQETLSGER